MDESGRNKYSVLTEYLRNEILSGSIKPGDRIWSENKLVEMFGVSRHTVRRALEILERDGYVEAIHGKGTFCSDRLIHMKKTKNIGVITTYISDYIFPRLIQGMDRVFSENGYTIILKNTGNSRKKEAEALDVLLAKGIDGVIIEPSKSQLLCRHTDLYQRMEQSGIPYIFIQGCYEQMPDKPHIVMDDCQGAYMVTHYLIELGHRHIAGVFKADDIQGKERHKGYVKALQEAGFPYNPDMVVWFHTEDRKKKPAVMIGKMAEQGVELDGVVCYNDQIAIQVMDALSELGMKVPEDVSVTGYDNSLIGQERGVGLTTIAHPQEKLGEMAAQLLLEKLKNVPEENSRIPRLIAPELIIRGSCISRGK
ncbi:GntR family transcriptional regulator [Clostridium sp. AM58-1XD]|uniref:GntR family transcriptional regulator n=1 Tax=Clostridium sp. AM58-1XD TaxID=2292307 RepID=UPI000E532DDF|nr:GntR family transcriptional regulator [Clostridium sp. AM58-1XD]RGY97709.1 GntR family transcriptional regulator [Clostridium sp. AM58-1XD]